MDLTVAILTKNEEKNIVEVIENAFKLTEKVLIVDSGSTDRTIELAKQLGARVVFRAWDNDFAAQRNFALEQVDTEWILYLDADERMREELIEDIKQKLSLSSNKCYRMLRKIKAFGFSYKHGAYGPDKVSRLFPTAAVKWEHKVHERAICALPEEELKGWLEHYTYDGLEQWWNKAAHYTTIWAEDQYAKGKRVGVGAAFTHSLSGFFKAYLLQRGFWDGWAGVYSSLLHVMYTAMKYLKLYELQGKGKRK